NIGMSGGPICNLQAQVVAVSYLNFADLSRAVLGVPGECFLAIRDELIKHGRRTTAAPRAWLGVLSYTLRDHVVIAGVMPGGPGQKAGLQQGDVVISIDDTEVDSRPGVSFAPHRFSCTLAVLLALERLNDCPARF